MKIFKLPDLGEGLQEAEIVEWHVKPGDTIAADQPLVAVETAKAIVEIPSPQAGRIEKLFCKNERAVIRTRLPSGDLVTLVPVAAILVASIRLHCLDLVLNANYCGATEVRCDHPFEKGAEMGWFEHGSTIVMFAPDGFELDPCVRQGEVIRMGRPLMRLPQTDGD